jgi:hypothetical protein
MPTQRRRTRDLIIIAGFVVLLAILFWPSGGDDPETDAAPEDDFSSMTPTPDTTSTPEPEPEQATTCEPGDSARLLNRWVGALNAGDTELLASMFPERGASVPTAASFPGMDQSILHSFTVHESGAMSDPVEVLDYLAERRQSQNEHWRIDDVDIQRLERSADGDVAELDRATVTFARNADDLPDHAIHGAIVLNCLSQQVLLVELYSDKPELALPIPVDVFLAAVGPYGTGEMRDLRMIVSTDLREDTGSLSQWDIRRIEANSMTGSYVERVTVQTLNGNQILEYIYDGSRWYLTHRGWREMGDLTGWNVLPLEIMLTRREPSVTADILRDHRDEIPEEGSITLSSEFEVREELERALAATVPLSEPVEGVIEVEVEDGNLVRTRYRLIDRQLGLNSSAPEIQWLHIHRRDRYESVFFTRPPGFSVDEQQYIPQGDLTEWMTLIERTDHLEGIGERFGVFWDQDSYEVLIIPSRGFSHEHTRGDDWPLTWEREQREVSGYTVIVAGPSDSDLPHAAILDTRRYRYEIRIDPGQLSNPDEWEFDRLHDLIIELLQAEQSEGGLRWIGPGN